MVEDSQVRGVPLAANSSITLNTPPQFLAQVDSNSSTPTTSSEVGNNGIPGPALLAILVLAAGLTLFGLGYLIRSSKSKGGKKKSLWQQLVGGAEKQAVSPSDAHHHERNFEKLTKLMEKAKRLNHEKFSNREFLEFFKLKSSIHAGVGEYKNLESTADLLTAAVATQKSFTVIYQTESSYCSGKQQEFYEYVAELLDKGIDRHEFKDLVLARAKVVSEQLKTEKGKVAIEAYTQEISKISEHDLGLKLLSIFKQYNFTDYSILSSINQTLECLERANLTDINSSLSLVMEKPHIFEKLSAILGMPNDDNFAENYSRILQYIGLKKRHGESYGKFQELLSVLREAQPLYRSVDEIRGKYEPSTHDLPEQFKEDIPGLNIYNKYEHCL